jgi:hopanoid biosynthesis associated protein HpnK
VGKGERGLKRLIVTADDFGLSEAVNEAVEIAHRDGILTATSLMVGEPSALDAVSRARRLPSLGVGLHLVVVDGKAVLPPAEIPALVDEEGRFRNCLACAGFVYFFHPAARRQLAREIRAQFMAFKATGLALDHVNAHHHMHLHPTVFGLLIEIGREFGLRAVRLPQEPLFHRGRLNWSRLLLAPWLALMRWRIGRAGLRCNDSIFGLSDSGGMDTARMLETLRQLPAGVTEVFCHPAMGAVGSVSGYCNQEEHAALTSPECAAVIRDRGIKLIAFLDLQ